MKRIISLCSAAVVCGMIAMNTSSADAENYDIRSLADWLLGDISANSGDLSCDLDSDGVVDVYDLVLMRKALVASTAEHRIVRVTDTEELKTALADAQPGDEIVLAPGEYIYSGSTPKGYMFKGESSGTADSPIILRSEDPDDRAIVSGKTVEGSYALSVLGDYWILRDLIVRTAAKGIIVDHANHTQIIGCEVYNIGEEGIHFRDNSSYCLAEDCFVHDTGLTRPGFGEGIYVGSAKTTTNYGHDCHYNVIRRCRFGPNIAAEHIDIKEYTIGTIVEDCTFDGTGISGENYADSFVDIKGNDCILRRCVGYRNGNDKINRAFELNRMDEGWGQNAFVYSCKAYMDTPTNALGKKMVFLNSWDCTETVWDNYLAYEDGELFPIDDESHKWDYYNCSDLTYGDSSLEENLPKDYGK